MLQPCAKHLFALNKKVFVYKKLINLGNEYLSERIPEKPKNLIKHAKQYIAKENQGFP